MRFPFRIYPPFSEDPPALLLCGMTLTLAVTGCAGGHGAQTKREPQPVTLTQVQRPFGRTSYIYRPADGYIPPGSTVREAAPGR